LAFWKLFLFSAFFRLTLEDKIGMFWLGLVEIGSKRITSCFEWISSGPGWNNSDLIMEGSPMLVDLFGSYPCSIENGRIKLPASFCKVLSVDAKTQFHVMKEQGENLFLYTQKQWEKKAEDLMKLHVKDGGSTKLLKMAGRHYTIEVDRNGRMTIPQDLREAAGMDKKVVVVGLFDHMEIWDSRKFDTLIQNNGG